MQNTSSTCAGVPAAVALKPFLPEENDHQYVHDPEAQTDHDPDDIPCDDHDRKHQEPEDCEPKIQAVEAAAAA
jgi:hypothetical protein